MTRKNYNTKNKKYGIIALDILIFIENLGGRAICLSLI